MSGKSKWYGCSSTVIVSILQFLTNSKSNNTDRAKALSTGGNCYNSSSWRKSFEWKWAGKKETQRPTKARSKRRKTVREKRARKLERTLKRLNTARVTRKRIRKGILKKRISGEEQFEEEMLRAPENRPKRGHYQREANHKGSEKEEGVNRVLSGFSLTLRPSKLQTIFPNLRLILPPVYNSNHVLVNQWLLHSSL